MKHNRSIFDIDNGLADHPSISSESSTMILQNDGESNNNDDDRMLQSSSNQSHLNSNSDSINYNSINNLSVSGSSGEGSFNSLLVRRRSSQGFLLVRQSSFYIDESTNTTSNNNNQQMDIRSDGQYDLESHDLSDLLRYNLSLDSHHEDARRLRGVGAIRQSRQDTCENTCESTRRRGRENARYSSDSRFNYPQRALSEVSANRQTSGYISNHLAASRYTNFNYQNAQYVDNIIARNPNLDSDTDNDDDTPIVGSGSSQTITQVDSHDSARRRSHPLTDSLNSVSLERQCRELWRLRAALFHESSTVDSWSNYHQRLSRRFDSGYRSLECPTSNDLPPLPMTSQSGSVIAPATQIAQTNSNSHNQNLQYFNFSSTHTDNNVANSDNCTNQNHINHYTEFYATGNFNSVANSDSLIPVSPPSSANDTYNSNITINAANNNNIRQNYDSNFYHQQHHLNDTIINNNNRISQAQQLVAQQIAQQRRCTSPISVSRPISRASLIASAAQPEIIDTTSSATSRCGTFNPFKASRKTPEPDDDSTAHNTHTTQTTFQATSRNQRLCGW